MLGLPFYGHSYELADREHFDVGDSSTGPGIAGPYTSLKGMLGYNEVGFVKYMHITVFNFSYQNQTKKICK